MIRIGYPGGPPRPGAGASLTSCPRAPASEPATFNRLHLFIGLLISAIALYLALRGVHWGEVGDAIGNADVGLLAAAWCVLVATLVVRAVRWRVLLFSVPRLKVWHLFGSLNAGYLMNNVLPFQVGELGRVYLLSELASISTTRSLSTVVVERLVDIMVLLLLLLLLAPFVPVPAGARAPAMLLGLAAVAA
ncbi:MAG TPA: lysylphosphatidylglycerol synthase transmembrane domain-containing protein, partial [Dehalococcoidia bacterium]|nr:lysylphosphatidylglycerol synthase transmembrane domain-containing protein [Dehalococcoidia bacterium]